MENFDRKKHWETIYTSKKLDEVSWYQPVPEISLDFIRELGIAKSAKIIDIGGGDSLLVDHLLTLGYEELTVLDISEAAIERGKKRLGKKAKLVNWIVSDVTTFEPVEKYDCWHDRAAFHFLTSTEEITKYLKTARQAINSTCFLVVGTFSENGPKKCSGIDIKQYSERTLQKQFEADFEKIKCVNVNHRTPFNTTQNFTFCSFNKK